MPAARRRRAPNRASARARARGAVTGFLGPARAGAYHAPPVRSVRFVTFGCKANQYDTQVLREALLRRGWREEDGGELVVINTCTVTAEAGRKARQLARRVVRERPGTHVAMTGCLAESEPELLRELPGVGWVLGNGEAKRPVNFLRELGVELDPEELGVPAGITEFAGHTRAFLKIQDGCDMACAFCIIPKVRGKSRSRPADELAAEVRRLVASGHREVVLCGIHIGHWGRELGHSLAHLLERLVAVEAAHPFRLRLSSIEATEVAPPEDELSVLEVMARNPERIAPHVHMPMQSGDDGVLRAMNRWYTAEEYLDACARIRAGLDRPAFSADVLAGFPGEDERAFENTLAAARAAGFARIHVFPFSPRPGTAAFGRGDGSTRARARAPARLGELAAELARDYRRSLGGTRDTVLLEGGASGLSGRYQRVRLDLERCEGPPEGLVPVELELREPRTEGGPADAGPPPPELVGRPRPAPTPAPTPAPHHREPGLSEHASSAPGSAPDSANERHELAALARGLAAHLARQERLGRSRADRPPDPPAAAPGAPASGPSYRKGAAPATARAPGDRLVPARRPAGAPAGPGGGAGPGRHGDPRPQTGPGGPPDALAPLEPAEAAARAARNRERAAACADLESLRAAVAACTACPLAATRTQTVFADGTGRGGVVFVGEGPGFHEDQKGVPFVGRAGALLTDIITKGMGLAREEVYIANVVKCRPPENRDPTAAEKAVCTPWLDRQIELVDPRVVVPLGRHAAGHVLASEASMGAMRARVHEVGGRSVVPTYHPAYLPAQPGPEEGLLGRHPEGHDHPGSRASAEARSRLRPVTRAGARGRRLPVSLRPFPRALTARRGAGMLPPPRAARSGSQPQWRTDVPTTRVPPGRGPDRQRPGPGQRHVPHPPRPDGRLDRGNGGPRVGPSIPPSPSSRQSPKSNGAAATTRLA